jgi:hypothetical protein
MTSVEGTLAILGIKTIRILITGLAEETVATPDLLPAEITARTLDVQTVEADNPTAGTDVTTATITAAPVKTTETPEITLETVAEAAETRGHGSEKRGHLGPRVGALAPTSRQQSNTRSLSLIQWPTNQDENTTCSKRCILGWREAAIVPPTTIP